MKNSASCFTLLAFLTLNSLFAQGGGANYLDVKSTLGNLNTLGGVTQNGVWSIPKVEDKTITGTNYLFKSFEGLYVLTNKAGNSFKLLNLNYNLTHGTLETKISKDSVFQYDLKQVDYVVFGNKKYKNIDNNTLSGLVLEVFAGKNFDIYKKIGISVMEGAINPMTQEKIQQDKYVQDYTYYVNQNGNLEKIELNKSTILKLVKDKQSIVKEYAKINNLDFSNEIDVNIILKYYESL
jgi:hypothetical protein